MMIANLRPPWVIDQGLVLKKRKQVRREQISDKPSGLLCCCVVTRRGNRRHPSRTPLKATVDGIFCCLTLLSSLPWTVCIVQAGLKPHPASSVLGLENYATLIGFRLYILFPYCLRGWRSRCHQAMTYFLLAYTFLIWPLCLENTP